MPTSRPNSTARREALLQIRRATLAALDGERLALKALAPLGRTLRPGPDGRLVALALGKAAPAMMRGARLALGEAPVEGARWLVVGTEGDPAPAGCESWPGLHPVPGPGSLAAGEALLASAHGRRADDVAVVLLSGGGSALAIAPAEGISPQDKIESHRALVASGAPIEEINLVRKHLSRLKGGHLARALFPARVLVLALSDVPKGGLESIASGPCSPDPSTYAEALEVVRARQVALPPRSMARLEAGARGEAPETPKEGDPAFARVAGEVLAGPEDLARAAATAGREAGFRVEVRRGVWRGEMSALRDELCAWARAAAGPRLLVVVGEPTLRVPEGKAGGRAQHLALEMARALDGAPFTLLAAGSDGRDGPTAHAGALVDGGTAALARARGLDLEGALASFESASAHARLSTALPAHPPRTNLTDLYLLAVEAEA